MVQSSAQIQKSAFTFVVLHYNTLEHTRACVASLLAQEEATLQVVIVDNGSTNGTGEQLAQEYAGDERIIVIFQRPNIGYARGVNIGFQYAKQTLGARYICLSNNDVVYKDPGFVRKVEEIFQREGCDVLGPAIYVPEQNFYQNPRWDQMLSLSEVDRLIHRYQKRKLLLRLGFNRRISTLLHTFPFRRKSSAPTPTRSIKPASQWNAQLHGASVFFGPRFIAERDGLNPGTVFSCEMDILCLESAKVGYSLYYCDEIEVLHHAHATIRPGGKQQRKADIAYLNHQITSARLFRSLLERDLAERAGGGSEPVPITSPAEAVLPEAGNWKAEAGNVAMR